MSTTDLMVYVFFFVSVFLNLCLAIYAIKKKEEGDRLAKTVIDAQAKLKEPEQTYDVKALLHDLTVGPGLIKIERVDPQDFLLRSPRHRS